MYFPFERLWLSGKKYSATFRLKCQTVSSANAARVSQLVTWPQVQIVLWIMRTFSQGINSQNFLIIIIKFIVIHLLPKCKQVGRPAITTTTFTKYMLPLNSNLLSLTKLQINIDDNNRLLFYLFNPLNLLEMH